MDKKSSDKFFMKTSNFALEILRTLKTKFENQPKIKREMTFRGEGSRFSAAGVLYVSSLMSNTPRFTPHPMILRYLSQRSYIPSLDLDQDIIDELTPTHDIKVPIPEELIPTLDLDQPINNELA